MEQDKLNEDNEEIATDVLKAIDYDNPFTTIGHMMLVLIPISIFFGMTLIFTIKHFLTKEHDLTLLRYMFRSFMYVLMLIFESSLILLCMKVMSGCIEEIKKKIIKKPIPSETERPISGKETSKGTL